MIANIQMSVREYTKKNRVNFDLDNSKNPKKVANLK